MHDDTRVRLTTSAHVEFSPQAQILATELHKRGTMYVMDESEVKSCLKAAQGFEELPPQYHGEVHLKAASALTGQSTSVAVV